MDMHLNTCKWRCSSSILVPTQSGKNKIVFEIYNQIGLIVLIHRFYHSDKLGPNRATTARLMLSSQLCVKHHESTPFVFVLPMPVFII